MLRIPVNKSWIQTNAIAIYDNTAKLVGVSVAGNMDDIRLSVEKDKMKKIRVYAYSQDQLRLIAATEH